MPTKTLIVNTNGEAFYDISSDIKAASEELSKSSDGILYMFIQHTSCALTINESFDPSAKRDMERFLRHLAPRNLSFIEHDAEGPDDSPSHMKSILLNQNLALPVEGGELLLGTWQGIYLAEFRDGAKQRKVLLKFIKG